MEVESVCFGVHFSFIIERLDFAICPLTFERKQHGDAFCKMAAEVAFIPVENCASPNFSIGGTHEKVSLSCMDFHNGFSLEKKVNQGTVRVLFAVDWQVRAFSLGFLHFWENV